MTTNTHLWQLGSNARPAGSAAAAEARVYCAEVLRGAGFTIDEQPFDYSAFPGAAATPIAGVVAALGAIGFYVGRHIPNMIAVTVIVVVIALIALALTGREVLRVPLMRRRGVNLEATRGGAEPSVWLVAHIDSKWQPVSMIARVAGVIGTSIGLAASFAVAVTADRVSEKAALVVLVLTLLANMPLMLSIVGDRNHGTLDNASGVAAVLDAVALMPTSAPVGVLITDAEELGLAGAHGWARQRGRAGGIALNCDSIDDDGEITLMYSRARPAALVERLEAIARELNEPLRVLRLIPGILTDSVALASAGWETVTLSRGRLRTLQRIHTSRDTLDTMRGTGIAGVARLVARTATELT